MRASAERSTEVQWQSVPQRGHAIVRLEERPERGPMSYFPAAAATCYPRKFAAMTSCTRIVTLFALACHLLLAATPVTSQEPASTPEPPEVAKSAATSQEEPVTIQAKQQEKKGSLY